MESRKVQAEGTDQRDGVATTLATLQAMKCACYVMIVVIYIAMMQCVDGVNLKPGNHLNNYAIVLDTSRSWRNYRHSLNAMRVYDQLKRNGFPESNILLLIADNLEFDPRNELPGRQYEQLGRPNIDYKYGKVSAQQFVRLLTNGINDKWGPVMRSDSESNVLIYITSHGGVDFLKFLDNSEMSSTEFAKVIELMYERGRYRQLLVVVDSCKAATMFKHVKTPNFIGISSSGPTEDSISGDIDHQIGAHKMDRFSAALVRFLVYRGASGDLGQLIECCPFRECLSTTTVRSDLFEDRQGRPFDEVPVKDFFGRYEYLQLVQVNPNVTATSVVYL